MRPAPSPDASSTASELLERAGEFAVLEESLVAVRETSRGRLVLVSGEAGIGKTAVLREFCEASGRSARVLWGRCDSLFSPRALGPPIDIAEAQVASSPARWRAGEGVRRCGCVDARGNQAGASDCRLRGCSLG